MKRISAVLAAFIIAAALLEGCGAGSADIEAEADVMTVTFTDVGKGDCILIEKDGKTVMIDTGYEDTSEAVMTLLEEKGIEVIDVLIITHYDKDHVGGAAKIAGNIETGQIYIPCYEGQSRYYKAFMSVIEEAGLKAQKVTEDVSFTLAGISFTILASDVEYVSDAGDEGNDNDVSLVVSAVYGDDSYLFLGDLEKEGIKSFLKKDPGIWDVVKMPHHGKKESNSSELIKALSPVIAVITDSADDPAADKVLDLLEEVSAKVLRTGERGTVEISGTGKGEYSIKTAVQ